MKTGTIVRKSVPEFGDDTQLFLYCGCFRNGDIGRDMTVTNALESSRRMPFASECAQRTGKEFSIPESTRAVGAWDSGRREAVLRGWSDATILLVG